MAPKRNFKETIRERVQKNLEFRALLLHETIESFLKSEQKESKIILRDYINATIGFDEPEDTHFRIRAVTSIHLMPKRPVSQ